MTFAMFGIEDMIPLLVFGGIVMGIWALLSLISNRNSQALDRLSRLSRPPSLAEIEDPTKAKGNKFQGLADAVKSISKPLMPTRRWALWSSRAQAAASARAPTSPLCSTRSSPATRRPPRPYACATGSSSCGRRSRSPCG